MKPAFSRRNGICHCEDVPLEQLAERYGTPLYVYSLNAVLAVFRGYCDAFKAFDPVIAFAIKANPSLALLQALAAAGCGADIVSGGELARALAAGVPAGRIVYAGVGKNAAEMEAALGAGVMLFNVESRAEAELLDQVATRLDKRAPLAVRVNPDVDPRTHAYIATGKKESKFGLDIKAALEVYEFALRSRHLDPIGIHCHIGSQITTVPPFLQAAEKISRLVIELRALGVNLQWIDLGGGLGIAYKDERPPLVTELAAQLSPFIAAAKCRLILEPGRSMVGGAGALLARVQYLKETPIHNYVIVDAAMNDLVRPSLYDAHHPVEIARLEGERPEKICEVVGPVCETGDFLAKGRSLPSPRAGDLLVIGAAGAYGMAMASNYNLRPRAAEVLVDGKRFRLVRRRETNEDLARCEKECEHEWQE